MTAEHLERQRIIQGAGADAAPEILTARLKLRAHRVDDLDACARIWSDPAVVRHITTPSERGEVWARILRYAGHWRLMSYGYWLIERVSDGAVLGEVGLADFQRRIDAPVDGAPEAGWVLRPDAHGQGYAAEAAEAVLKWTDEVLRASRSFCLISPENTASLRLARRLGYHPTHRTAVNGRPNLLMQRARPLA